MARRIKIPNKSEVRILVKNKHTCCICHDFKIHQELVIHHIDENPRNNNEDNLAVLCLTHASMADAGLRKGKLGSGKKLKPDEIRLFKKTWESKVVAETRVERRILSVKERKQLEILYKFEIHKRKYEIISLPKRQQEIIKRHYGFLQELVFGEWIGGLKLRSIILDAFYDIAMQSLNQNYISFPLIEAISGLFLQLAGPQYVKMYKDDKKLLLRSLDVLNTIGDFEGEFSEKTKLLSKVCDKTYELSRLASEYRFNEFLSKAKSVLNSIKENCLKYGLSKKGKSKNRLIKKKVKLIEETIQSIKGLK